MTIPESRNAPKPARSTASTANSHSENTLARHRQLMPGDSGCLFELFMKSRQEEEREVVVARHNRIPPKTRKIINGMKTMSCPMS